MSGDRVCVYELARRVCNCEDNKSVFCPDDCPRFVQARSAFNTYLMGSLRPTRGLQND